MAVSEEHRYFRVTPQIVPADRETVITIRSLDPKKGFGEQEHYVYLEGIDVVKNLRFSIYSLQENLFGKVPMKGDFHMHSNNSDGEDDAPSLEAVEAYREVPIDLLMLPVEEVHPDGNNISMINFGGKIIVNDFICERCAEEGYLMYRYWPEENDATAA